MNNSRFIPQKRIAIDGKVWWCVFDMLKLNWSTYMCHGKHFTKKACQLQIDLANQTYSKYLKA